MCVFANLAACATRLCSVSFVCFVHYCVNALHANKQRRLNRNTINRFLIIADWTSKTGWLRNSSPIWEGKSTDQNNVLCCVMYSLRLCFVDSKLCNWLPSANLHGEVITVVNTLETCITSTAMFYVYSMTYDVTFWEAWRTQHRCYRNVALVLSNVKTTLTRAQLLHV